MLSIREYLSARRERAARINNECARIDQEIGSRLDLEDGVHQPTDEQLERIVKATAAEAWRRTHRA